MCTSNFYEIRTDDRNYPDRWFLGDPVAETGEAIDARKFTYGKRYQGPHPRLVPIDHEGRCVAFHLAAFDMPVVSSELADKLQRICPDDIERWAITIYPDIEGYEILNIISTRRCLDEQRSGVRKWQQEDGRPDKIGQYREIERIVIVREDTQGSQMFRLWGSLIELIVSDTVKQAIQDFPNLGVVFQPLEVSC